MQERGIRKSSLSPNRKRIQQPCLHDDNLGNRTRICGFVQANSVGFVIWDRHGASRKHVETICETKAELKATISTVVRIGQGI